MVKELIETRNGQYIDHIELGVSDTKVGASWIKYLNGVTPTLYDPDPEQYFWSATLDLGGGAFLEIIGPNPIHKGVDPFKQLLSSMKEPKLSFWYLATNDFNSAGKLLKKEGFKLENEVEVSKDSDGELIDYRIAMIGPGFRSELPNLVQWNAQPAALTSAKGCSVEGFEMRSPDSDKINKLIKLLGIEMETQKGDALMKLSINTPNGLVEFEGGGMEMKGLSAMFKLGQMYLQYLFNR